MIRYVIPLQGLKFSTNKIYAGIHWSKRKQIKDSITGYAGVFCRPAARLQSYPVEICYQFFFRSRPLDTLNTSAMAKMFEDAFRSLGILEDDDPKHVARSVLEVYALARKKGSQESNGEGKKGDAPDEDHLIVIIKPHAKDKC